MIYSYCPAVPLLDEPPPAIAGNPFIQDLGRASATALWSAGVNSSRRASTGTSAEVLGSSPLSKPLTMTCMEAQPLGLLLKVPSSVHRVLPFDVNDSLYPMIPELQGLNDMGMRTLTMT